MVLMSHDLNRYTPPPGMFGTEFHYCIRCGRAAHSLKTACDADNLHRYTVWAPEPGMFGNVLVVCECRMPSGGNAHTCDNADVVDRSWGF